MALLDVKNLSISFGGLRAVDGFEMQIEKRGNLRTDRTERSR